MEEVALEGVQKEATFSREPEVLTAFYAAFDSLETEGTLRDLALLRAERDESFSTSEAEACAAWFDEYRNLLIDINDLGPEALAAGQVVKVYEYPNASPVKRIRRIKDDVFFATEDGLLYYDGVRWGRSDLKGMDRKTVSDILTVGDEVWVASDETVISKGRGRFEITGMHANWLPDLTDDLFYDFVGFVASKDGLGTFGGSVTFLSYGSIVVTGTDPSPIGTEEAFEIAMAGSYGTSLSSKLAGGVTAKVVYSHLTSGIGAGGSTEERGGKTWAFALDLGLLYHFNSRLTGGLAITNLGPSVQYVDDPQRDNLPRNLAVGLAYKFKNSEYIRILGTVEANKGLIGLDDGFSGELKEVILNGGIEATYADLISGRVGYIYDQEGHVKTMTLGAGFSVFDLFQFDLAYIPSSEDLALANTLRLSLTITP
jgi:hypothetical protein